MKTEERQDTIATPENEKRSDSTLRPCLPWRRTIYGYWGAYTDLTEWNQTRWASYRLWNKRRPRLCCSCDVSWCCVLCNNYFL